MKKDGKAKEEFKKIDPLNYEFFGWENMPRLCLRTMFDFPIVYDMVKQDVIKHEYYFELNQKIMKNKARYLSAYAGLVG
jgi:hypothetical protein